MPKSPDCSPRNPDMRLWEPRTLSQYKTRHIQFTSIQQIHSFNSPKKKQKKIEELLYLVITLFLKSVLIVALFLTWFVLLVNVFGGLSLLYIIFVKKGLCFGLHGKSLSAKMHACSPSFKVWMSRCLLCC